MTKLKGPHKRLFLLASAFLLIILLLIVAIVAVLNVRIVANQTDQSLFTLYERQADLLPASPEPADPYKLYLSNISVTQKFCSLIVDETDGSIIRFLPGTMQTDQAEDMEKLAGKLADSHQTSGFVDGYRYLRQETNGEVQFIFLDCNPQFTTIFRFISITLILFIVGAALAFLVAAYYYSYSLRTTRKTLEQYQHQITDIGHEFKTPLAIINAEADVLALEYGENEWLSDIQLQISQLNILVNDLVLLTQIEQNETSLQMIEFPVSDVVLETASSFKSLAQSQNKTLLFHIAPMLTLRGNERTIHHLINALVDNALKYAPEGSEISVSLEQKNKTLLLSICNPTIEPIPKKSLDVLFERFYRINPEKHPGINGFGIGLSIAKAIVDAHNGQIQASSPDGQSMKITVQLPIS